MKILIVEDDDSQRLLLRHVVAKKLKCQIFEAKNGIEGLRQVKFHSPHLVILDVGMPVMNGIDMLKKLRQDDVHKSIPVVIITAVGDKEIIHDAVLLGISGYILKPFTVAQVDSVLSKFIAKPKVAVL